MAIYPVIECEARAAYIAMSGKWRAGLRFDLSSVTPCATVVGNQENHLGNLGWV